LQIQDRNWKNPPGHTPPVLGPLGNLQSHGEEYPEKLNRVGIEISTLVIAECRYFPHIGNGEFFEGDEVVGVERGSHDGGRILYFGVIAKKPHRRNDEACCLCDAFIDYLFTPLPRKIYVTILANIPMKQ